MSDKVLVTGGAGFIGSHVADALVKQGHEVWTLDNLSGGWVENVPKGVWSVLGDILDHDYLSYMFNVHKFKRVYHLAAYAAESLSHRVRRFNYMSNIVGSANLINESIRHGVERFIFISSSAVYGDGPYLHKEDERPAPTNPYGVAKLAVEMDLECAWREHALKSNVFRLHNVYGPRQNTCDPNRNVVAVFLRRALNGEPLPVVGDGHQTRCFTYVEDVAKVITSNIFPGTYNVGSDAVCSVGDLAKMVCEAVGVELRTEPLPARSEPRTMRVDHSKLEACSTLLADGLRKTAEWIKANPRTSNHALVQMELP